MSQSRDEIERIKRLRDQQLRDRDPRARDRKLHQQLSTRRSGKRFTLRGLLNDLQAKWKWMLGGALIGIALAIVFTQLIKAAWAEYVGYIIVLFCIVMGRVFGAIVDWGDEDWDKKY